MNIVRSHPRRAFKRASLRKQQGFVTALILGALVLLAIVVAVVSQSNKGGSGKMDLEAAKGNASAIIERGNAVYAAAQRVAQDRDLKTMTLTATSSAGTSFGLYDPNIGVENDVKLPGKALTSGTDTSFTLDKTNITENGIGAGGAAALAIAAVLPGVTDLTCQFINKIVFNSAIDASIPVVTSGTAISTPEGCAAIGGVNTYYKVLGPAV